ncbi:MAG: ketopantoate reductase family protein [Bacillota bacterium]|nr:ketopantoate reductase family protein [Bacillota bacterium]
MRIAILGAGSLGTIIGGLITKGTIGKHEVTLIDTNIEHIEKLNNNGATITGFLEFNYPVVAITPDKMEGIYDLVILLTKQTYNDVALSNLLNYIDKDSSICTLQNGIPEEFVSEYVGKDRTVGGAVGFGATWIEPGVSMLTSKYEAVKDYAFDIGEINGEITPRIKMVQEVLSNVGTTEIMTNLMEIRWSKVLMNATFSGMSAALGCTFGEVMDNEIAMRALSYVADETVKTAHANNYELIYMNGLNMDDLELKDNQTLEDKMELYHIGWDKHRDLKASMLQDLEKGIPCEIDYINGIVAKKGKEKGVSTPFNDKVIQLVKEAEEGKYVPDYKTNLKEFEKMLNL